MPWPPKRQATSRAPLVRSRGPTHQPHILSQITQGPRNYRPMLDVLLTWCFLEKIDCDNIVTFSTMHGDQKIILLSFHFNDNQVGSSHMMPRTACPLLPTDLQLQLLIRFLKSDTSSMMINDVDTSLCASNCTKSQCSAAKCSAADGKQCSLIRLQICALPLS